ncbi:nitroreductase family protein [Vagococcus intermedius]|uniref:Nitroreductase family protein n=1 Tax=Vagococcus intermedius TaxID=2991418 RepID=A0AAF0CTH1_9ENTE|nr:nitroreductase family protein [Vagococcus intermedius]WEG72442.1 nitroreductase family protein [Vagococcus intermedius]WEG74529.1 nitroreductase family protein [Vagococcus intermedius]
MTTHIYKNNDFSAIMKGRRSIRKYDTTVKISQSEMTAILKDTITAPSSINMQPWRFVVISSPEGKEKLKPLVKFNATQNDTSAAMILIFGDLNNFDNADKILSQAVAEGLMPEEVKKRQLEMFTPIYNNMSKEKLKDIVLIDAGLVAMQFMLTARAYGYDTNPIGGFDHDNLAQTFGLDSDRYLPVMIISIGKADEDGYSSVRLPVDDVTTWV